MKERRFLLLLLILMVWVTAFAQKQSFKGVVVDGTGEAVIGASVLQKGTSNGTVTDLDGHFTIAVEPGATLVISYIGYTTQEVKAAAGMRITLRDDEQLLSEVVVVGYGVQKKSVVTASIAKVSSEDIGNTAPVRMDNALKGLAAGVNVTAASGAPGEGSKVQVRGIGTINNADPLYIVDGMPLEDGRIDYINPSDIESIEVLKDAASGAIYGARAANGVILVTTKSGKLGKVAVNYNASFGWQTKWKTRNVLNARDYMVLMNEGYVNAGMAPLYSKDQIANPAVDTDWQEQVFNDNAPVQNHELNVSGATERVNYYLSMGYYDQEGIVGGDYGKSNYNRMTLRSNTKYVLFDDTKERQWLNKLTISSNLSFSRSKQTGDSFNTNSNGILNSTLTLAPTLPVTYTGADIETALAQYANYQYYVPQYDDQGGLYMVPGSDYDNQFNPVAWLNTPCMGYETWHNKFVGNFAADLQIGFGVKYRFSYGADMTYNGVDKSYTAPYYLTSSNNWNGKTGAKAWDWRTTTWQIENVLSWDHVFGKHTVGLVLGQSAKKTTGYALSAGKNYLVDTNKPWVDYATGHLENDVDAGGAPAEVATLASLFARASYNYDERYMLQFTIRRDGSSRFGWNNHYATFPSFSAGWNITNEKFMEGTRGWLSNLKLRASWGKNGNEDFRRYAEDSPNFRYIALTTGNWDTNFGRGEGVKNIGVRAGGLSNPDLKWEESVQTDLGLDFGFLQNAITFSVDYFVKKTNGMLMDMPVPNYVADEDMKPVGNVGEMKNSGLEFELAYKFHIADAKFAIKANASYLKNELVKLGNSTGYMDMQSATAVGTFVRGSNGEPFPYFYGYQTMGVFQNEAEVQAYTDATGNLIQPNAVPGDFRFADLSGPEGTPDGKIDEYDKTKIGKCTPDWTFGLNLNAEWKGFDLNMFWQGTRGNDIFDMTMRVDRQNQNLPNWMLGRWTGEGTSNDIPRYVVGNSGNMVASDLYVCDGSYLRLKNLQLGYTLPKRLTQKAFIDRLRFYVMAENLVTFTKYQGYDPEISSGSGANVMGVDWGVYPQARTWTIGVNLGF